MITSSLTRSDGTAKTAAKYTKQNGGTPLPSLAFFHIALPEYNQAASDETGHPGRNPKRKSLRSATELRHVCLDEGNGDILGVFVGHDHDDDYAVFWKGILLAYGRYTGGDTVYNNLSNGARVIEMTEGSTNFRTWIRLKDGEVINTVNYPSDFIKKKD